MPGTTTEGYWDGHQWTPHTGDTPAAFTTQDQPPPPAPKRTTSIGIVGICFILVGIAGVVVGMTGVDWFHFDYTDLQPGADFHLTAHRLATDPTAPGFAKAFLAWLVWVVLALAGVLGIAACVPSQSHRGLRGCAAAAAVLGIALSIGALADLGHRNWSALVHAMSAGPFLVVFGFLAMAFGAAASEVGT